MEENAQQIEKSTVSYMLSFWQIVRRDFNVCFFVGLGVMMMAGRFWLDDFFAGEKSLSLYLVFPIINGILTMLTVYGIRCFLVHKHYIKHTQDNLSKLLITAFIAGMCGVYINVPLGSFLLGVFIVYFTILKVHLFAKKMANLLPKNSEATMLDVADFFNFFINLIVAFSAINLVLNIAELKLFGIQSFNFGEDFAGICDTLYFTVATVTTVGYGDIVPQTHTARIIVSLECLTSYIMFALMIGIISRGIEFGKKE